MAFCGLRGRNDLVRLFDWPTALCWHLWEGVLHCRRAFPAFTAFLFVKGQGKYVNLLLMQVKIGQVKENKWAMKKP